MKLRVSIGALGCALFIAVPALAQAPGETTTTVTETTTTSAGTSAETPAATSGPAVIEEHPAPAAEPTPAPPDTYAETPTEPAPMPVEEHDEQQHGFEMAVRVAYGIPMGDALDDQSATGTIDETTSLSDVIKGQIPLQLDLGYRINNYLFVGAYGSYGFGFKPDVCDNEDVLGFGCDSPSQVRIGGELLYNILPVTNSWSPWIGAGIGYEWLNSPIPDASLRGMEFFNVQAGVDFRVADHMRFGPYALFSMGQYSKASDYPLIPDDLDDKGTHEWLQFGLKATFGAFGGD